MSEPNLEIKGTVRVTQTDVDATLVDGSNSGMFAGITFNGEGDATLDVDEEFRITARDMFEPTLEGALQGIATVTRVSETQVRIHTFEADGTPLDQDYGLVCTTQFLG